LQDAKSLIDIVIADEYLHWLGSGCSSSALGVTRERPAHTRPAHTVEYRCSDRPMPPRGLCMPRSMGTNESHTAASRWGLVGQIASLFSSLLPVDLAVQRKKPI